MAAFLYLFVIALGLCLGSFATALAWRLPRGVSMLSKTRSACPACSKNLTWAELVPVLSWLRQRGACRSCGAKIGWIYPGIELATLALCLGFYHVYGFALPTLALFALAPVLTAMIALDLQHKIIPDALNLAVFLCGIAALCLANTTLLTGLMALGGAALYAGFAWMLRAIFTRLKRREPLGLGDVKFFGAAGVWLGPSLPVLAEFLMLSGGLGIVLALGWKKAKGEDDFPFGPALAIALVILLLSGRALISGLPLTFLSST